MARSCATCDMRMSLSEAEVDAAGGGEVHLDDGARRGEGVAGPGAGGDPLAFAQAAGACGAFVGEPGEKTQEIAGGVGAGALDADDAVDGEHDVLFAEVDRLPVGDGGTVDEAAVHLEVGDVGETRCLRRIGEGGLQHFNGRVTGGHRGERLFACVRLCAWRKVAADEEGDLGFEAAIAPALAGERAAGGGDPRARHGREHGRGFGRGRADLPAADLAEGSGYAVRGWRRLRRATAAGDWRGGR